MSHQTWPAAVEFDVYSWRFLRRIPSGSATAEVGWVIQGPTLGSAEGGRFGLDPGTYGIARCVLHLMTGGEFGHRWCEPSPYPGSSGQSVYGNDATVLWRSPAHERHQVLLFEEVEDLPWPEYQVSPCLSLDLNREGFWRCKPHGALFYPVENGRLLAPTFDVEVSETPFDRDDVVITRMAHVAVTDTLFGIAWSVAPDNYGDEVFFFAIDPYSGARTSLGEWYEGQYLGAPASLATIDDPPEMHEQLIPVVADTPGSNGTHWSTELWFFNPSPESMAVTVRRVARPDANRSFTLAPHESLAVRDVLPWVGGGPTEHDALVVASRYRWGQQLAVSGRISTRDVGTGGRFGHAVHAVPGRVGYSNHTQFKTGGGSEILNVTSPGLRSSSLSLDHRNPGRFRHNVGVVNDSDDPLTLTLVWGYADQPEYRYNSLRPEGAEQAIRVAPHSVRVARLESLFPAEVRAGWPPRLAVLSDRPAAVWVSMIDNLTGDATFVPFTNFTYENDDSTDRQVLPVVAHLQGQGGVDWRTDLYGYELYVVSDWASNAIQDMPFAVFRPVDSEGDCMGTAATGSEIATHLSGEIGMPLDEWMETMREVWYDPTPEEAEMWWRTIFPDVIRLFPECEEETSAKGALEIATGSWFSGFSRTYATRPDGGTYGGMLPLYPPGGWPTQHFGGLEVKPEQRINVGLYNGNAEHAITHELRLYAADGTLAATRRIVIHPHRLVQRPLERIMGLEEGALDDGLYGLSVIPLDDPELGVEGRSWAFVSLVDNVTNDPVNLW